MSVGWLDGRTSSLRDGKDPLLWCYLCFRHFWKTVQELPSESADELENGINNSLPFLATFFVVWATKNVGLRLSSSSIHQLHMIYSQSWGWCKCAPSSAHNYKSSFNGVNICLPRWPPKNISSGVLLRGNQSHCFTIMLQILTFESVIVSEC